MYNSEGLKDFISSTKLGFYQVNFQNWRID